MDKARQAADDDHCLANLHSIAQGAHAYSAAHAGAWPIDIDGFMTGDATGRPSWAFCPACRTGDGGYLFCLWTAAEIEAALPKETVVVFDWAPWHPRTDDLPPRDGWRNRAYLDGHAGRAR